MANVHIAVPNLNGSYQSDDSDILQGAKAGRRQAQTLRTRTDAVASGVTQCSSLRGI